MAAAYGHTTRERRRVDPAHAARPPRGAGDRGARRGEARLLRPAPDGLPLGPAGVQPLVREPAPARDRARDGDEAAAAAARRAGGRDEPRRDARDHRADRQAARRGRLHDPRDRARHARRRGHLRPRRRARPRRQDRRGLVRRRSRPTRAWSRRTSARRGDASERGRTADRCSRLDGRRHYYGQIHILQGVEARGRRGRARLPARRQRLGQVDDAEDDPRHRPAAPRHASSSTART